MITGFNELDNIVKLNKPQLIVCSSVDPIIEVFLLNIVKSISIDQKIPTLYIDNNLIKDCSENIRKEREILFNDKKHEMEVVPMLMEITDNTLDDIVSNISMLDRFQIMDNRIIEGLLTQKEIQQLSQNNSIELLDIIDGEKYVGTYKLFTTEEKEKIKEADSVIKSSPLFLEHIERLTLKKFKELCYEYKKKNHVSCILLNDIRTIDDSDKHKILKELNDLSKNLDINIIIGNSILCSDVVSLEDVIKELEELTKFIDTILYLKDGGEYDKNILHIWILKNISNVLGKVSLLHLEKYKKCFSLERNYE